MVCWEGNFKINNFQKTFVSQDHKSPCLELIFSAGLISLVIGFSHIITTLEEAYWNTYSWPLIVCFPGNTKMFLNNKVHVYRFIKYDLYASKGYNLR